MLHNHSRQVIGVSTVNRTNMNSGGTSVPKSISNYVESGGTVSEITQSPHHQEMVSLKIYQMMETAKNNTKAN